MQKKYVLLDRDGTIIVDKHYLSNPDEVELLPNAIQGLQELQSLGFGLVIVSNQSGVGRGYFSKEDVERVHDRLEELCEEHNVFFDRIYYSPHTPEDNSDYRKPNPGMALQAAHDLHFDLDGTYIIGDKKADVELAYNVGAKSILVLTGHQKSVANPEPVMPAFVADDLLAAAQLIAQEEAKKAA